MPSVHPVVAEDLAAIAAADLPWERLRGRRVLVSGASGLIGAYLVEALLARGDLDVQVTGLVRNLDRAGDRFAAYAGRSDLRLVSHDVVEPLGDDLAADVVVHAASQPNPLRQRDDYVGVLAADSIGTRNLLEHARRHAAQAVLFVSSAKVYGDGAPVPTREDDYAPLDPLRPGNWYGEGKRLGEALCVAYAGQHGVPATIVRPFHVYGPGFNLDDGRLFADLVADVVRRRPITLTSDGSAKRTFCYASDVTTGLLAVLLRGEAGTAYNLGHDGEMSVRDLAELLAGEYGLEVRAPERAADARPVSRTVPSLERIRALGWQPTVDVREGFARTIRTFDGRA